MDRQGRDEERAREKAAYLYSSALERGDFETVAAVLREAEGDAALEQIILELNQVYEAEAEGQPAAEARAAVPRRGLLARLFRPAPSSRHSTGRGRLRPRLIAGLALGAVLLCVAGWWLGALQTAYNPAAYTSVRTDGLETKRLGLDRPLLLRLLSPGSGAPQADTDTYGYALEDETAGPGNRAGGTNDQAAPADRLIVRTGNIVMTVRDTRAAQDAVEQMMAEMAGEGAFIVSSQEQGGVDKKLPRITLTLRVPATRFGATMDRLAGLAVEVVNRNEAGQDVTEEYVDQAARLESLEVARQRLLTIMREGTTTRDVLDAEQQLTSREAEIESITGRMQYLSESARLSSIEVDLRPYVLSQPVSNRWRPAESARGALAALLDSLRAAGDILIYLAILLLPWAVVLSLVSYGVVRLVRRLRHAVQPTVVAGR